VIHGVIETHDEALGPTLVCADEQNPRNAGRFVSGWRLVGGDGNGLIAEKDGARQMLLACDGCLESLIRRFMPAGGADL
jgi:hypothetical protein